MSKEEEEEAGACGSLLLERLPQELLCAIFSYVVEGGGTASPRDMMAWCLTCSTFNAVCDDETRHRCHCYAAWPVLFDLALSPVFGAPIRPLSPAPAPAARAEGGQARGGGMEGVVGEARTPPAAAVKLSWKLRAQLLSHLPSRLTDRSVKHKQAAKTIIVDKKTGRKHTNRRGGNCNLLADHPFVSTNRKALAGALAAVGDEAASGVSAEGVLFRGVEYFEMTVTHNTQRFNQAAAIGISQFDNHISFLGWNNTSIAYHSDDGTVRHKNMVVYGITKHLPRCLTGDVLGCGVDWDTNQLFFTLVRAKAPHPTVPNAGVNVDNATTEIYVASFQPAQVAWHPAIASMVKGDVLRVNFGHEPFVFDVKAFIEQKRSGFHSTAASDESSRAATPAPTSGYDGFSFLTPAN